MEKWKAIEGYEGLYEVSNTGLVKSIDRMQWNGKVYHSVIGIIKKQQTKQKGYKILMLWKNSKYSTKYVHRLVAQAFLPNPNNLPNVCHWDSDPSNNSVENLYWGTQSDNLQQMVRDGRHRNQYS